MGDDFSVPSRSNINKKNFNLVSSLQIWSTTRTWLTVILLISSPFIIDGYNLATFQLTSSPMSSERKAFREGYLIRGGMVNLVLTLLVLLFIAFAIYKSRIQAASPIIMKVERRLIYQALISSIFIINNFALKFYSTKVEVNHYVLITNISAMTYYFHNASIIITHFIFSPSYRKAFCEFYSSLCCSYYPQRGGATVAQTNFIRISS